ncbi:hypothetical protein ACFFRR_004854 [Megaselia abdita]
MKRKNANMQSRQSSGVTSYIQDFSVKARKYLDHRNEENLVQFNRSASLLCTLKNLPDILSTTFTSLESTNFFIDMYSMLDIMSPDFDVFWTCLSVLQQISKNLKIQQALSNDFHYMVPLTKILRKFNTQEKVERVLGLMQDLTYGIVITWEQPYLTQLIKKLVDCIYCDDFDETISRLATSVLINLCHKNFCVTCLLLRTVNISSLSRRIMSCGVLASKMMIILAEDLDVPSPKEMEKFIKSNFHASKESLNTWDVPQLTHIVDFIVNSETNKDFHSAVKGYLSYEEEIKDLLDHLSSRCEMDDSSDDGKKNQQSCVALICKLIRYLVSLNKGIIQEIYNQLYDFLENWLDSEIAGASVLELLVSLVENDEKNQITNRISRDSMIMDQIIGFTENNTEANDFTTASLRLILVLLKKSKTEKVILTKVTESFFDKILTPIIGGKTDALGTSSFTKEEVSQCIFCLLVLVEFSQIAKQAYFEKVCNILQMKSTQFVLAKGMFSENGLICEAVFEISKFEYFPKEEVSKLMTQQVVLLTPKFTPNNTRSQWPNINELLKSNQLPLNRDIEDRLDALLGVIEKAHQNSEINSVATSQLIEVYSNKISLMKNNEKNSERKLESANEEVIHLSQQVALQKAELEKVHAMNYRLHLNQERLQTECRDLGEQKTNLKSNITNLMKKMSEQVESIKINEKRLEVKSSELIVMSEKFSDLSRKYEDNTDELDRLKSTSKEYASRIDKLKKSIDVCESDIKEKKRSIDEKEREIAKYSKTVDDLKESLVKSENMVKLMEGQIAEKNECIRGYENELSETEEMRKTILSLMESKRPKRKA